MMEWQTIETAPKDGTNILLYVFSHEPDYGVGYWNGDYWSMTVHADRLYDEFGSPTHWMPLPEPPKG